MTFIDQNNPKRQTADPLWGSPKLSLSTPRHLSDSDVKKALALRLVMVAYLPKQATERPLLDCDSICERAGTFLSGFCKSTEAGKCEIEL